MTNQLPANVSLIGMPGSGKSTVGVLLAKRLGLGFLDTDIVIQVAQAQTLQEIMDERGFDAFCQVEEDAVLSLDVTNHVIATGGSVVYGATGMRHLASLGTIVFLRARLETLESRLSNLATRGVALKPGQTLVQLFHERNILYTRYADITIECDGLSPEEVCQQIQAELA